MSLDELFGGRMDIAAMLTRLRGVAEELELPFGERIHTYNSRRSQELGKWAEQQGRGELFHDAIYHAYFVDGLNITDPKVLTSIAAKIGLDQTEAQQVLDERSFAAEVDADWQRAHELGVTSVPTLVYGQHGLVGFRPYEDFRKLVSEKG